MTSFPSLGGGESYAGSGSGNGNHYQHGGMDLASTLKIARLQKMFPVVWDDDVRAHFVQANFNMDDAIALLRASHPGAYVEPPPSPPPESVGGAFSSTLPSSRRLKSKSKFKGAKGIARVTTGHEVSALYKEMRQTAIETAKARNKYFQQAAQAYLRGNRAVASNLSQRGRDLDRLMKRQHQEAAAALFEARNGSGSNGSDGSLDLHGLHVAEAIAYVQHHLEQLEGKRRSCHIIAGAGRHSDHRHLAQGKQARLLPAVVRYLSEAGYEFKNHDGVLEVLLV